MTTREIEVTTMYRAEIGFYEESQSAHCSLHEYRVVKQTPCGVWIELYHGGKRKFINLQCEKKWAHPSVADAMYSLKRRKQRQVRILAAHLAYAERCLDALNDGIQPSDTYRAHMYQFQEPNQ